MGKVYEVLRGTVEWHKIRRQAERNRNGKSICYYIIPEVDPMISEAAAEHMVSMSECCKICILQSESVIRRYHTHYEAMVLREKQMKWILAYFRTRRDTMLLLNASNVYILSFRETGGIELERLYHEQIYDSRFLIAQWLLPDKVLCEKRRGK